MIEFHKTTDNVTERIDALVPGCWVSVVEPTNEEKAWLATDAGIVPEKATGYDVRGRCTQGHASVMKLYCEVLQVR